MDTRNLGSSSSLAKPMFRQHSVCRRTLSLSRELDPVETWMPTRCTEVWSKDSQCEAAGNELRYTLRKTKGRKRKYVALSHRWRPTTENAITTRRPTVAGAARAKISQMQAIDVVMMPSKVLKCSIKLSFWPAS